MTLWEIFAIVGLICLILEMVLPSMFFLNLAVAALMTLSCGKLLNIEQHGVENAEQYYSTDEEILTASADLYLKMRNLESNAITLKPLLDGDFWAGGGQHGDNSNLDKLAEYAFDAEDGTITGYFKGLYSLVFSANNIIDRVDPNLKEKKKRTEIPFYPYFSSS